MIKYISNNILKTRLQVGCPKCGPTYYDIEYNYNENSIDRKYICSTAFCDYIYGTVKYEPK